MTGDGARRGAIYTVPPGAPFLHAVARAIVTGVLPSARAEASRGMDSRRAQLQLDLGGDGGATGRSRGGEPILDLPAWTILLPTRRAARALQEGFLKATGGSAMLLPAIRPIAEADEDLDLIERAALAARSTAPGGLELPPAIDPLARKLLLTRLVIAWSESLRRASEGRGSERGIGLAAGTVAPAQALGLARALARLMDDVETEGVSLAGLAGLVPEEHSVHWQQTLDFLRIVTEHWPAHLAETGLVSPAERRSRAILAEAQRIAARPLAAPVIVAGVTGSVPATAELMRAVLADPLGAIVLPGLDLGLDDGVWRAVGEHPAHPQHGLHALLASLGVDRRDVAELPGCAVDPPLRMRSEIVGEALLPAGTLDHWRGWTAAVDRRLAGEALGDLGLIEAATAEEEAEAVALAMRSAAETPGLSAALVSPDRLLARRVAIRLAAWGIRVDDSAGRPLAKTMPGAFLDLIVGTIADDFAPASVMALLKHPLTRLGLEAGEVRRRARRLEIAAFRRPYLGRGIGGIRAAIDAPRERPLDPRRRAELHDTVARLAGAFAPLVEIARGGERLALGGHVEAHVAVAEALATPADAEEAPELWREEAGEAALAFAGTLTAPDVPELRVAAHDYPDLWRALVAGETVRPRIPVHPRLFIWGPYEARLQQPDLIILGSLNEGTWPKAADPGPWLNRGMRKSLGLPVPEVETGRAAHDLTTLMGAPRVLLTRAAKVDGAPTVRSRWLERILALLDGIGLARGLGPADPLLGWAGARDRAVPVPPARPPMPRPPVALRPRRASVSDIETWIANPYAIFARRVLRLEPMADLGAAPGAIERGTMLHRALRDLSEQHAGKLPDDAVAEIMRLANEVVLEMSGAPRVAAFWLPRLERFARWFADTEPGRRAGVSRLAVEVSGEHVFPAPGGDFKITARADRIDMAGRHAVITDYKTGKPPAWGKVKSGHSPQLPLEAALLARGAFDGFKPTRIADDGLRYIGASGGEPPGNDTRLPAGSDAITELADKALDDAMALIRRFDREAEPYTAARRAGFDYRFDAYAHLARRAEWESGDMEEGE